MGFQNLIMTKLVLMTLCLQGLTYMKSSEAASLFTQCASTITTVESCLNFASGHSPEPTKDCCNAVSSLKQKQPVCLCFFIDQVHNGSNPQIKTLGIQELKLIQLPSACHLTNASLAECPKLLGISPSSPAAAIFMHNYTSPAGGTASSSTATPGGDNSSGFKHKYGLIGGFLAVFVSVFLCTPSVGNLNFLV